MAFHDSLDWHSGVVYEPFSTNSPSDITYESFSALPASQSHRHNSPVVFDEDGWTASTDAEQSSLDEPEVPIGDAYCLLGFILLYSMYKFVKKSKHLAYTICICVCLSFFPLSAKATISLHFNLLAGHIGDSISVTPTLSTIPEGAPYLCWKLYYDAACTHEVSGTTFTVAPDGEANTVYFTAPPTGTYYLQTVLRAGRLCNSEEHEQQITRFSIYPSDADIILVRRNQQSGIQLNMRTEMPANKKIYGVMEFDKSTVNNSSLTYYERYNYFVSFPFDVRVGDISGLGTYGSHWLLEYYDGLSRAQNGYWADSESNWKRITDTDSVMHAHQGYILKLNSNRMAEDKTDVWPNGADVAALYFPALSTTDAIVTDNETIPALSENYLCTIDYSATLGTEADRRIKDSYWRCIGVPSMSSVEDSPFAWKTDDLPYLYEWDMSDNSLHVVSGSTFTFEPTHAYLVQNGSQIIWRNVTVPNASVAARKHLSAEQELEIRLQRDSIVSDRTFIRLSDLPAVTSAFDFGFDLSKEPSSNSLYTLIGYERVAANCMSMNEDSLTIPIGMQITTGGDYTLSLRNHPLDVCVILKDSLTGRRTNLLHDTYTLHLEAGTYLHRFSLEISAQDEVLTGWTDETGELPVDGAHKRWHNGRLYIFRNGILYDVTGRIIQHE